MLKKWIAGILALAMIASFTACADSGSSRRNRDDRDEKEEQEDSQKDTLDGPFTPGDGEFPDAPNADPVPTEPEVSYEDQIALIVEHKMDWIALVDFVSSYSVAITDLDQNGRLEVIVTECAGSGMYSNNIVFEVSEAFDSIVLCQENYEEYISEVDLMQMTETTVYFDGETDTYYYECYDVARGGWAWNGSESRAFWLKDGMIFEEIIVAVSNDVFEDGSTVTTYYDRDGSEITEEEYEKAVKEHFSHCEELTATFLWKSTSVEGMQSADSETLTALLEASWEGFSLN